MTVCRVLGQNADPLKRQRGIHVEREQPWEILFNFLIVLQQPIQQFIQWCISDVRTLASSLSLPPSLPPSNLPLPPLLFLLLVISLPPYLPSSFSPSLSLPPSLPPLSILSTTTTYISHIQSNPQRAILVEAVRMTLRKHEQIAGRDHIPYKRHGNPIFSCHVILTWVNNSLVLQ